MLNERPVSVARLASLNGYDWAQAAAWHARRYSEYIGSGISWSCAEPAVDVSVANFQNLEITI